MDNEREVIDRTQCKLPHNHYMYKVVGTYGENFQLMYQLKMRKEQSKYLRGSMTI